MTDEFENAAAILKALGHPVRLQIIEMLRAGETCVCHFEAALGLRQAYISQHFMVLRKAGLVVDRRDGLRIFYSLAGDEIIALLDALHAIPSVAEDEDERAASLVLTNERAIQTCTCPSCRGIQNESITES